jgi:prepilin-type N-terminal cleavage/methylation domain-containing protein
MSKFFKFTPLWRGKRNSGFTLVETLVAVSIFSVSILGIMSVLASGISSTSYAKRKIVAAYLAQEGLEYMKNMRDTYMLYGGGGSGQVGWDNFHLKLAAAKCTNLQALNRGCVLNADGLFASSNPILPPMQITQISLSECIPPGITCPNGALLYDSATGRYGFSSGTPSGYVRRIYVYWYDANHFKISSNVSWQQGSGTYHVSFGEDVYTWIE